MTDDLAPAHAKPASLTPVPKVAAAGAAGALGTMLIYVAGVLGIDLPAEVAAAIVVLVMFGAGYLKRG